MLCYSSFQSLQTNLPWVCWTLKFYSVLKITPRVGVRRGISEEPQGRPSMRCRTPPGLAPSTLICFVITSGRNSYWFKRRRKEGRERCRNSGIKLHRVQPTLPETGRAVVEWVFVLLCCRWSGNWADKCVNPLFPVCICWTYLLKLFNVTQIPP